MITGIVAQEFKVLPRGTVGHKYGHVDFDNIFFSVITTGLDQHVFAGGAANDDELFVTELPVVLSSDAIYGVWTSLPERILVPSVAVDHPLRCAFYGDYEQIFLPDVRIPGFLLPQLYGSDDVIHPTPLILDPGMWRAELWRDVEAIYEPVVFAAQTLFVPPLNSDDVVNKIHLIRAGVLGPSFYLGDADVIHHFATEQDGFNASFFVDTGAVLTPACAYDGIPQSVMLSNNNLSAEKVAYGAYAGARGSLPKDIGKYYFEVEVIKGQGEETNCGIIVESASYEQMGAGTNCSTVFFNHGGHNYDTHGSLIGGSIRSNGQYWTSYDIGYVKVGDVVCVAVDFENNMIWFRRNDDLWNSCNVPRYNGVPIPNADADPTLVKGGASLAGGRFVPAVVMGDGSALFGYALGDKVTGNFGVPPFKYPPPQGFGVWQSDPVFRAPGPDRFGDFIIGTPCTLDDLAYAVNVTMSNGNLTAMHNATTYNAGVFSTSAQNYGRYYFEMTVDQTHGASDHIGMIDRPGGDFSFNSFQTTWVYTSSGDIWSVTDVNKSIGACPAGTVIGVAVDLVTQTIISGGNVWYRKRTVDGDVGPWNGDFNAEPILGLGGVRMPGPGNYALSFAPMVGFGGTNTSIGDKFTANFGQTPFAMERPDAFSIWPAAPINYIESLQPERFEDDDAFPSAFIETANKQLYHPEAIPPADDTIFAARSFGGNFHILPDTFGSDDVIASAGNLATFDGENSSNVTISLNGRKATLAFNSGYTGARSSSDQHAGKYFIEFSVDDSGSGSECIGVIGGGKTYFNMISEGKGCVTIFASGSIYSNNVYSSRSIGTLATSDIVSCAFDLTGRRCWIRKNNGPWNNIETDDPSTNTGGIVMEGGLSFAPAVGFPSSGGTAGDAYTCNFGQAAFYSPIPTGFLGGWPNISTTQRPSHDNFVPHDDTFSVPRLSPTILRPELWPNDDSVKLVSGTGGAPTLGPGFHDEIALNAETIYPVPLIKALAAFLEDSASLSVALSNGNLTATHINTNNNSGTRSISYKTTGKYYFEVTMTNVHGAFDCAGLITQVGTYTNLVTNGSQSTVVYKSSGNIFSNSGLNTGKTLGAIASTDVISFAIDMTARKAWLRKNGGNWNGLAIGSENPATGTGGVTIAPTVAFAPAIGFGGSGTAANDEMTINFGGSTFFMPAPAGFGVWGQATAILPVLDLTTTYANTFSLSADGLTGTHLTTSFNEGIRTLTTGGGGKLYFEGTRLASTGTNWSLGILIPTATYQAQVTYNQSTTTVQFSNGNIFSNNANSGKTLGQIVVNSTVAVAVDLTARLAWFRKKQGGTGVISNWNNDALADPATGVGGIAIGFTTEVFGPSCATGGGVAIGEQMQFNFGQNAYVLTPPAGFGNWVASR